MRLIDADELMRKLQERDLALCVTEWDIKEAPTIDAAPVVRCGECKWFYESDTVICCEKHTGLALARKDDYCPYGERNDKT